VAPAPLLFQDEDPGFRMTARDGPANRQADDAATHYRNIVCGHLQTMVEEQSVFGEAT